MREVITSTLNAHAAVGAPATWVLGNHDVCRPVSRYARPQGLLQPGFPNLQAYLGLPVDLDAGRRRARAAALLSLALPGGAYVYQGEELGLAEVEDIPLDARQDPIVAGTNGENVGRDGCRVPVPWALEGTNAGFSPDGAAAPWLPQPADWGTYSVEAQDGDPAASLELYRKALAIRAHHPALGDGELAWVEPSSGTGSVLAFTREPGFGCWVNFGDEPLSLPEGATVLLSSDEFDGHVLPKDTTAWLQFA
jgi:alpha-glucosidase